MKEHSETVLFFRFYVRFFLMCWVSEDLIDLSKVDTGRSCFQCTSSKGFRKLPQQLRRGI